MARGAMLLCGAMVLAACADPAVPDSASGGSPALVTEALAVTRLCLSQDKGMQNPAAVLAALRARGYAARVPLSPLMAPRDAGIGLRVMASAPCSMQVARSDARLVSRTIENELRAQGFRKAGADGVWSDGTRRVQLGRDTIQTARYLQNDTSFSLTPAG